MSWYTCMYPFVVNMYRSRGTEGNSERAGLGGRKCTGTYSDHHRPVSSSPTPHICCVGQRARAVCRRYRTKSACRPPPITHYRVPSAWYLIGNGGAYLRVSIRLGRPTMCLHARASCSIPSTGQQPKPCGKQRLASTTLPVDGTRSYMIYVGLVKCLVCLWPFVFNKELGYTSMSTWCGATAECCIARILGFSRFYRVFICTGIWCAREHEQVARSRFHALLMIFRCSHWR